MVVGLPDGIRLKIDRQDIVLINLIRINIGYMCMAGAHRRNNNKTENKND